MADSPTRFFPLTLLCAASCSLAYWQQSFWSIALIWIAHSNSGGFDSVVFPPTFPIPYGFYSAAQTTVTPEVS